MRVPLLVTLCIGALCACPASPVGSSVSDVGVDVLISAPQKGWSGPPCAGFVMLSDAALAAVTASDSTSFACDLGKWLEIMRAYENGGHAYHATMPTEALRTCRDVMREAQEGDTWHAGELPGTPFSPM